MKKIFYVCMFMAVSLTAISQNAKCPYGVNSTVFTTYYNQIKTTVDSYQRLTMAKNFATTNCLTSYQVKQIALLLYSDQDKIDFCRNAYATTTDQENFYDVYDAFAYFSNVFRLHDYLLTIKAGTVTGTTGTTTTTTTTYSFPALAYPNYAIYVGTMGCLSPMSDNDFNLIVTEALKKTTDTDKLTYYRTLQAYYCITTAQIMKLSLLFTDEKNRLTWFKESYAKAYDKGNFASCELCITNETYKLEFQTWWKTQSGTTTICSLSDGEMVSIKTTLTNEPFNNTRVTLGKQILESKKCFTSLQIKDLVGLYDFESSRLEIAKYAYDYCTDKENYYLVNEAFSFSSSKTELTNYIKTK